MFTSLRATAAALALTCAAAHAAPPVSGMYLGEIGAGNKVLMSLETSGQSARSEDTAPVALTGEYHYARIWSQDSLELNGKIGRGGRLVMRETLVGPNGKRTQTGAFKGQVSHDGGEIAGTWTSGDARHAHAFVLVRAAEWRRQSVQADAGVRTCVRPRFFDARYDQLNRELAQACDYFLADGHEGPGLLTLEIDSVSGPLVAAVAYATTRGHDLPPEVITVDLSGNDGGVEKPLPGIFAWHQ
jgi:hypothetical protein